MARSAHQFHLMASRSRYVFNRSSLSAKCLHPIHFIISVGKNVPIGFWAAPILNEVSYCIWHMSDTCTHTHTQYTYKHTTPAQIENIFLEKIWRGALDSTLTRLWLDVGCLTKRTIFQNLITNSNAGTKGGNFKFSNFSYSLCVHCSYSIYLFVFFPFLEFEQHLNAVCVYFACENSRIKQWRCHNVTYNKPWIVKEKIIIFYCIRFCVNGINHRWMHNIACAYEK